MCVPCHLFYYVQPLHGTTWLSIMWKPVICSNVDDANMPICRMILITTLQILRISGFILCVLDSFFLFRLVWCDLLVQKGNKYLASERTKLGFSCPGTPALHFEYTLTAFNNSYLSLSWKYAESPVVGCPLDNLLTRYTEWAKQQTQRLKPRALRCRKTKLSTGAPTRAGPAGPTPAPGMDDTLNSDFSFLNASSMSYLINDSFLILERNCFSIPKKHKTQEGLFLTRLPICATLLFRIEYQFQI